MRVFFVVAVLALGLLDPSYASACSCIPQNVKQAFLASGSIFAGRVVKIEPNEDSERGGYTVTFEVSEAWKGVRDPILKVNTAGNSAICGYAFKNGQDYLVYATKEPGYDLRVSLCSRTQPLDQAAEDLKELGEPAVSMSQKSAGSNEPAAKTAEPSKPTERADRCNVSWGTTSAPSLPLLALGFFCLALRMRRRWT